MKILKLLGIFIAVLGIVIGALYIKSALTDADSDDIKIILPDNVTDQRAEMEDFWNRAEDWDSKHFEAEYSHIQQCLHANYIDHAAANQLTSLLCNLVINRMHGLQVGEYHKSDCNIGIVKGYMKGIDAVCQKLSSYNNDDRVRQLRDIEKLYDEISTFGKSSFIPGNNLSENADGSHQWLDYDSYAKGRRQKAADYRENSTYLEFLKNITVLKNGILEESVNSRLTKGKKSYGSALANAIAAAYEAIPAGEVTQTTFSNIRKDYQNFYRQYGRNNESADDVMSNELTIIEQKMRQNTL
jgi:hypothetical protein